MSAQAPILHKQADRMALMADIVYFASELIKRIERLVKIEPHWRGATWGQAAALVRRVRGEARRQIDEQRRCERLARRAT
jgi:hypothetical protein